MRNNLEIFYSFNKFGSEKKEDNFRFCLLLSQLLSTASASGNFSLYALIMYFNFLYLILLWHLGAWGSRERLTLPELTDS